MTRAITTSLLADLFTGWKTNFRNGFAGTTPQWSQVATRVPSSARSETYSWLGAWPKIREWIGDRHIEKLTAHGYTLTNKKFQSTVSVKGDDISDDQLGIYGPMFEELGRATAIFPDERIFPLLADGFTAKCYDGQPFFDTEHPVGSGLVSNDQGGSGTKWYLLDTSRSLKPLIYQDRQAFNMVALDQPRDQNVVMRDEYLYGTNGRLNGGYGFWQMAYVSGEDLDADAYEAAKAAMGEFTDDSGRKLGVRPKLCVVPPSLEGAAKRLFKRSQGAGGASNEWEGDVEILVANYL